MLNKFCVWLNNTVNSWSRTSEIVDEITTYHYLPGCHYNKTLLEGFCHRKSKKPLTGHIVKISNDGYVLVGSRHRRDRTASLLTDRYLLKNKDKIDTYLCLTEVKYVGLGFCRIKYQYGLMGSLNLSTKQRIHS